MRGTSDDDGAKPDFGIEYEPVQLQEATKRRRRRMIALGVTIPIIVVGVALGATAGVALSNIGD